MIHKVKDDIKKYGLIAKNDKVIVGVSGGPDSLALLYCLNSLKKELKFSLYVAHLDHMLRKGSREDLEFVMGVAKKLKLPFVSTSINVKAIAGHGSVEQIARNARLGFLYKAAKDIGASKIALGHNLDDQAETVLMRVVRGTGLYGLAGILPKRRMRDVTIIRPFLDVRRSQIEGFLKKKKLKARIDPSNLQDAYLRNKIRHALLPSLEKYNRNIKDALKNLGETAAADYDLLLQQARSWSTKLGKRIDIARFNRLHPAIQKLVLRDNITRLKGDTRAISFKHILEIQDMILNRPSGSIVDLPKNISVVKKKNRLIFYLRKK